jgi:tyrosinase
LQLSHDPKTVRTPDDKLVSQSAAINKVLLANGAATRDKVYYLIARQTEYAPFSNTGYPAELRNGSYDSIESIHNQIHGMVGGSGHMAYIPFSAFDPIFWLHHCNIDRLFAIWSAINPDSYVVPQVNDIGTYAEGPGATEDVNTPLWPFRRDSQGRFHTAATARNTKSFGYSYPEIVDWGVTTTQLASNVRLTFKALYNPTGTLDTRSVSRIMRRAGAQQVVDWFVNLSVKRNLDTPISINFFLGDPPVSSADWATASNLIVSQMVLPDVTLSKAAPPALAQIPLSRSIQGAQKSGKLNGTDESTIRSFLKTNLHWTVSNSNGQIIEPTKLTDLQISVVDQAVQKSNSTDQFHRYGKLKPNPGLQWNN